MAKGKRAAKSAEETAKSAEETAAPPQAMTPMKKRRRLLLARLKSPAIYPLEQMQQFRVELKAMEKGTWRPGFKLPTKKTAIELFLDS